MNLSGLEVYTQLVSETRTEFPEFRIVNKEASGLMKTIDVLLRIITFGAMTTFMSNFVTTIGYTVYVPPDWSDRDHLLRAETLRHERVHMRQRKRMGAAVFSLVYLFWVFPIGLAIGRRNLEQEAYAESIRAATEYFGTSVLSDQEFKGRITRHFTSAEYFWMWPFRSSIEAWYDDVITELRREFEHK